MNATLISVADAVVAWLNAGSYSREITAIRKYQPYADLAALAGLHVTVVPKSIEITPASRTESYNDCAVDVGVQQKIDVDDSAVLDALMMLVEELADRLRMKRLPDLPEAAWLSIANEPAFAPEHLDQQRTFTSVLTVRYRVRR